MDHHQFHHHELNQYQHQMTITNNNPYNTIITTQPPTTTTTMESTTATTMIMDDEKKMMTMTTKPQEPRNCPRCNSSNTKFCYYNNYSLAQPRYLCKSCRRYWTEGGSLRNVPVGGGSRKSKKLPLLLPNSSTSSPTKNLPDLNPPFVFTSSSSPSPSNPSKTHDNNNELSLSFSSPMQDKRAQGHYGHFTEQVVTGGQNGLFQAPMGMIQFRQEYDHDHQKKNLGFSLDRNEEEIGNHDNFVVNGGESKMMYPYGGYEDHHHHQHVRHDDGNKKREGGSSNELWSGIILGGDRGEPTW